MSSVKPANKYIFWNHTSGSDTKKNLNAINTTGPIVIVIGSEGKGLRSLTKKVCPTAQFEATANVIFTEAVKAAV